MADLLSLARKLRKYIEFGAQTLDDEQALDAVALYPTWKADTSYSVGYRVRYNGQLYRVLTDHVSQTAWIPDASPSLFTLVLIPDENIIPDWTQPESTNPYSEGDKVKHKGKTWESEIDNNVWEPSVYGWKEVG